MAIPNTSEHSEDIITPTLSLDLRSYQASVDKHLHNYHQLVLPVSGQLDICVDRQSGQVNPQQAAIIAAGSSHEFTADGDNHFLVADIPFELARHLERLPAFLNIDPAFSHYIAFLHNQVLHNRQANQQQMLMLLIQLIQERNNNASQQQSLDRRIAAARDYLDQHYDQPISLARLSQTANLSPRQLSHLFRKQLGLTPQQYQLEKRMQQAWLLLSNSKLSIQRIAETVGYQNLAAFSDRFRKHFGRSPRHFRNTDS